MLMRSYSKKCIGMSAVRKVAEAYEQVINIDPLAEGCAEGDDALVDEKTKRAARG